MGGFRRKNLFIFSLLIMVNVSCSMIIQGDMLVTTGANTKPDPGMSSGVQLTDASRLWPEGKVYYRCRICINSIPFCALYVWFGCNQLGGLRGIGNRKGSRWIKNLMIITEWKWTTIEWLYDYSSLHHIFSTRFDELGFQNLKNKEQVRHMMDYIETKVTPLKKLE